MLSARAHAANAGYRPAKSGANAGIISGDEESALWQAHAARPWDKPGCVVKISTLRSQLPALVGWIRDA